jgi:hypothetical protein
LEAALALSEPKPAFQSQEDFAEELYDRCLVDPLRTTVPAGFGTPVDAYPSYCMDADLFDDVDALAILTSDRRTYR